MSELFEIDGSVLEGGGQILRNSISLSAILGIPIRVTNIRAGRPKPGLAAQHLKGIQLVAEMCQGKLKGVEAGSTQIEFIPGKLRGGHYMADPQTAGSISLLLQVSLPCALMADGPVTLSLKGGTNADMAPQIDYMTNVFKHTFKRFGADFSLTIHRRGYFPRGGGHVTVEINPVRQLQSISLTSLGSLLSIQGSSFVAGRLPIKMAYQMADGAKEELRNYNNVTINCYKEDPKMAPDNCCGMILWSKYSSGCVLGSDTLTKRNVEPYDAGRKAGSELRQVMEKQSCVDTHTQDQIIIYMALAQGKSTIKVGEVTLHTKTAIHVAELIGKTKFHVESNEQESTIECNGLGITNNNLPS